VKGLVDLVNELETQKVHFRSITDGIDTKTSAGRFGFSHVASDTNVAGGAGGNQTNSVRGGGLVASQMVLHATHTGPFMDGTPPTGRTVAYPLASFTQVEGDKIRSEHVYLTGRR
jgi:hypothetical protein